MKFLTTIILFFQISSSNVYGVVKDEYGNNIGNVKIEVYYKPKNITYKTETNKKGVFILNQIETGGQYIIKACHKFYLHYEKKNVEFELGDNQIDIRLKNKS